MTVKDLVELLEDFTSDSEVLICCKKDKDWYPIDSVEIGEEVFTILFEGEN